MTAKKCAARAFVGRPGQIWGDCPHDAVRYRRGRWYCKEHFRPLKPRGQYAQKAR